MRAALRVTLLLTIALSIFSISIPLVADASPAPKSGCCPVMSGKTACAKEAHHGGRAPMQDRDCCVTCPLCFTLFLTRQPGFISNSVLKGELPVNGARIVSRVDQPPVPPPRSALV